MQHNSSLLCRIALLLQVPTVKESDEFCKPICTQMDEGSVVQRGTVLTTMLPVVKGLCCNTQYTLDAGRDVSQGGSQHCQPKPTSALCIMY